MPPSSSSLVTTTRTTPVINSSDSLDIPTSVDDATVSRLERKITQTADCDQQIMDSDESVEVAMRLMDIRHKTSFYNWVRNEEHLEITSLNLKRIVRDHDPQTVSRGLRWLFEGWSMNGIASLLIKVYYERGLDNPSFTRVISELNSGRTIEQQTDLIATLVIGEDSLITARFFWMVVNGGGDSGDRLLLMVGATRERICQMVDLLAVKSQWTAQFMEAFLVRFDSVVRGETDQQQSAAIKRAFEEFHAGQQSITVSNDVTDSHLHRKFAQRVLREFVLSPPPVGRKQGSHQSSDELQVVGESCITPTTAASTSAAPTAALRRLNLDSCSQMSSPLSVASSALETGLSSTLSSPKSPLQRRASLNHPTAFEE